MNITDITFKNGLYFIKYVENNTEKTITGKLVSKLLNDEVNISSDNCNIMSQDVKEAFWINQEEYFIAIPKLVECLPDDKIIPLGLLRYYITNHMDSEELFSLELVSYPEEIDATELQYKIMNFLSWDM